MVVFSDIKNEVVFLIEQTSNLGLHFTKLRPYVEKIVEYFNEGPILKEEFPSTYGNTSYCLIGYGTSDAFPSSGIYNQFCSKSSSIFSKMFTNLVLHGGGGENHALLSDGMATVLDVFDSLSCDHYENCKVNKYCIVIGCSLPYDMRSTEGNTYCDMTVDELALKMAQLGVNLSVICPVKKPVFQSLFDKAAGNLVKTKSFLPKDFVKEKHHMVCLRGIDLLSPPEQPKKSPTPPDQTIKIKADESSPPTGGVQPPRAPTHEAPAAGPTPGGSNLAWTGFLEWHETVRPENNCPITKVTRSLACHVSTPPGDNLHTKNWPEKLIMQLIPQTLLTSLGTLLHNSRTVGFHFAANDPESLRALYRVMATSVRFAGCVHFVNANNCDVRILLLIFSPRKRAFVGLIPNDQKKFLGAIKKVIEDHKKQQQLQGKLRQHKLQLQQQQQLLQNAVGMANTQQTVPELATTLPVQSQTAPLQLQHPAHVTTAGAAAANFTPVSTNVAKTIPSQIPTQKYTPQQMQQIKAILAQNQQQQQPPVQGQTPQQHIQVRPSSQDLMNILRQQQLQRIQQQLPNQGQGTTSTLNQQQVVRALRLQQQKQLQQKQQQLQQQQQSQQQQQQTQQIPQPSQQQQQQQQLQQLQQQQHQQLQSQPSQQQQQLPQASQPQQLQQQIQKQQLQQLQQQKQLQQQLQQQLKQQQQLQPQQQQQLQPQQQQLQSQQQQLQPQQKQVQQQQLQQQLQQRQFQQLHQQQLAQLSQLQTQMVQRPQNPQVQINTTPLATTQLNQFPQVPLAQVTVAPTQMESNQLSQNAAVNDVTDMTSLYDLLK